MAFVEVEMIVLIEDRFKQMLHAFFCAHNLNLLVYVHVCIV